MGSKYARGLSSLSVATTKPIRVQVWNHWVAIPGVGRNQSLYKVPARVVLSYYKHYSISVQYKLRHVNRIQHTHPYKHTGLILNTIQHPFLNKFNFTRKVTRLKYHFLKLCASEISGEEKHEANEGEGGLPLGWSPVLGVVRHPMVA